MLNIVVGRVVEHVVCWHNTLIFNRQVYNCNEVGSVSRVAIPIHVVRHFLLFFVRRVVGVYLCLQLLQQAWVRELAFCLSIAMECFFWNNIVRFDGVYNEIVCINILRVAVVCVFIGRSVGERFVCNNIIFFCRHHFFHRDFCGCLLLACF